MKGQELGLLLKLVALNDREAQEHEKVSLKEFRALPQDWCDWTEGDNEDYTLTAYYEYGQNADSYTVRALARATSISKSQISLALQNCQGMGLIRKDRVTGLPRVNRQALHNFIVHAARYVFPVKPGPLARGIATTFASPALEGELFSSGELIMVWPDARGNSQGQSIEPLFKGVPHAVRRDRDLYAMLALVDTIRLGRPRESKLATEKLATYLRIG
ncbi:hypothetical protein [Larsenimonas suaedae]|uniref:MarR family transcriptional regulator n=1 Tax=Larsenimonas suaedae TaxID=1851019 RepID=A0ABU1GRH0_9GAMM|nr:hypothetical protein [Larsenimonas suaedae]MCM2972586.1 hypothetical protein [Larsenimonas suaedae]MDR5894618.1 hypothetical protein [Larsenimonas suaedae]